MASHQVSFTYLSQEDLLEAGCFDLRMAMEVAEKTMITFEEHRILFPEKIVQIFDPVAQDILFTLKNALLTFYNILNANQLL